MRSSGWIFVVAAMCGGTGTAPLAAQDQEKPAVVTKREIIPGSELMTSAERERYRQRIRAAQSADEASTIRGEHVKQMRDRARLRGLRLAEPASPDAAR